MKVEIICCNVSVVVTHDGFIPRSQFQDIGIYLPISTLLGIEYSSISKIYSRNFINI